MANVMEGTEQGEGRRVAIVVSRFNEFFTKQLLEGALAALRECSVADPDLDVAWVPGAFELPTVAQAMASSGRYHAVLCLGAVIRGETPHFEYVAGEAARGIAAISRQTGVPTIFGVITADTVEQARERCSTKDSNKGAEFARATLQMASLMEQLRAKR